MLPAQPGTRLTFAQYDRRCPGAKAVGTRTVSFIVKIWIEEQVDRNGQPAWHGLVTQVSRDERQYIRNLGEVTAFIAAHLEANDIKLSRLARLGQWLMRQRLPR